jgi:hypothetical protein
MKISTNNYWSRRGVNIKAVKKFCDEMGWKHSNGNLLLTAFETLKGEFIAKNY